MFKKTEESEWTRFSKALGGKDQPREREVTPEPEDELLDDEPSLISPPTPVAPVSASSAAPQTAPSRPLPPTADAGPSAPAPVAPSPVTPPAQVETWTPAARESSVRSGDAESVIGEGTTVDGSFRSEHSIRILGSVQNGEVESKQRVSVENRATVAANITAEQVTVAGEVNGKITCTGRVEIMPTGRVTGEITAGSLIMQEGAFFEGHLRMSNRAE